MKEPYGFVTAIELNSSRAPERERFNTHAPSYSLRDFYKDLQPILMEIF